MASGGGGATDVAYVKVTMRPRALHGAAPGDYYVRWSGGGKTRKSAVVTVSGGEPAACGGSLVLYARARKDAGAVVAASDDPRDSLRSVVALVRVRDDGVATQAVLDIGDCIAADGEITVPLGGGVRLVAVCAAKAIGDSNAFSGSFGKRASGESMGSLDSAERSGGGGSVPSTVAVDTAAKLERLRQDMSDKAGQIEVLKERTAQIDEVLASKETADAPTGMDTAALVARVRELEEERVVLDRERAEADRKVVAHVQHAQKIKTTYNQLAAWYNNLRNEHAELQKRHPESTTEASRDLPSGDVATTHEDDARRLEQERNDLRRDLDAERAKLGEIQARHSEELAVREQDTEGLRSQVAALDEEAARRKDADRELHAELAALKLKAEDAEDADRVRAELARVSAAAEMRERDVETLQKECEEARMEVEELRQAKEDSLVQVQEQFAADRELDVQLRDSLEAAALQEAETEDKLRGVEREVETLKSALAAAEGGAAAAGAGAVKEIEEMRLECEDLRSADAEAAGKLASRDARIDELAADLEKAHGDVDALRGDLKRERAQGRQAQVSASPGAASEQLQEMTTARDHAMRELFRVRKSMNNDIKALRKEKAVLQEKVNEAGTTSGVEGDSGVLQVRVEALEVEKARLESECEKLQTAVDAAEADAQALQSAGEVQARSLREEMNGLSSAADGVAALQSELAEKEKAATDIQVGLRRAADEAIEEASQLSRELDVKEEECADQVKRITDLENQVASSVSASEESSRELVLMSSRKDQELLSAAAEAQVLAKTVASQEEAISGLTADLSVLRSQLSLVHDSQADSEAQRDSKIVELSAVSAELTSLRDSMEAASKSTDSAASQLSTVQTQLAEVLSEREALAAELELAKSSFETEKSNRNGSEEEIVKLKNRVGELQKESKALDEREISTKRRLEAESAAKTAFEGELVIMRASLAAVEAARNTLLREVEVERANVVKAEETSKSVRAELLAANGRTAELDRKVELLERHSGAEKDSELETLREELEQTRRDVAAKAEAATDQSGEMEELQDEFWSLERELANKNSLVGKLESDFESLSREKEKEIGNLRAEFAELQETSDEKDVEFDKLTGLLKDLNADHAQATAEYETLHGQYKAVKRDVELAHGTEERLKRSEESSTAELKVAKSDLAAAEKAFRKSVDEKRELATAVEELELELRSMSADREAAAEMKAELQSSKSLANRLESELEELQVQNKQLATRVETVQSLEQGADGLVDELIRCKMDLANAWEQIDTYKRKVKQLDPTLHVSPNVSGGRPGSTG